MICINHFSFWRRRYPASLNLIVRRHSQVTVLALKIMIRTLVLNTISNWRLVGLLGFGLAWICFVHVS